MTDEIAPLGVTPQSGTEAAGNERPGWVPSRRLKIAGIFVAGGLWVAWSVAFPYGTVGWAIEQFFSGPNQSRAQGTTALPPEVIKLIVPAGLAQLDGWVTDGGKLGEIDERVVKPCGTMIFATASAKDQVRFTTTKDGREEFDVRVDICVKLTITRSIPQDTFKDPDIVRLACKDMVRAHAVYADLCARAKLTP